MEKEGIQRQESEKEIKYRNVKGNQLREKSTGDIKEWEGRGERRKAVKAKRACT
jgi:hypothetical protein